MPITDGRMPAPPNQGKYLRDDLTWQSPTGGSQAFPVGSVFLSVVATNPATLLGYGTWAPIAAGRMLVGQDANDPDFILDEQTGGSKTHTLTIAEMPAHSHPVVDPTHNHTQNAHTHTLPVGATDDTSAPFDRADAGTNASGANATASAGSTTATNNAAATGITLTNTGNGAAFNQLNPYFTVRVWKRIA